MALDAQVDTFSSLRNAVKETLRRSIWDSFQQLSTKDSSEKIIEEINALYVPQVQKLADTLATRGAELGKHRNNLIPFHRLPNSVIATVFEFLCPETSELVETLRNLASVCRLWRDVILNDPALWKAVNVKRTSVTKMALHRSRTRLLIVKCEETNNRVAEFLSIVATASDRWKKFYFYGSDSSELTTALESPTPAMTELYLVNKVAASNPSTCKRINLSDGSRLRLVDLEGLGVRDYLSPRLQGIEKLSLIHLTVDTAPTCFELATMLAASPQLVTLALRHWKNFPEEASEDDPESKSSSLDTAQIGLPQLKTLELYDVPKHYTLHLLPRIHAPACSYCFIDNIPWAVASSTAFPSWQTIVQSTPSLLLTYSTGGKTFRIGPNPPKELATVNWLDSRSETPGGQITITTGDAPESLWPNLGDLIGSTISRDQAVKLRLEASESKLVKLASDIEGALEFTPELPAQVIGEHFSFVDSIEFGTNSSVTDYLDYFSSPRGDGSWPCPKLTCVSLTNSVRSYLASQNIEHFVRRRLQAAKVIEEDPVEGGIPKLLSEVHLPSLIRPIFAGNEELREVKFI